jgi:hypothetical protein
MLATRYRTTYTLLAFLAIWFLSAQVLLIGQATQPSGVQASPIEGSENAEGADADLHSFRVHVRELFNQGSYSELDNIPPAFRMSGFVSVADSGRFTFSTS